jgi:transcriptional regulator with XRE-family HTH domain
MKAERLRPGMLARALLRLRRQAGLTQVQVADRTRGLKAPLQRLTTAIVSLMERDAVPITLENLFSFVVACSHDGATLRFSGLEAALWKVSGPGPRPESPIPAKHRRQVEELICGVESDLEELRAYVLTGQVTGVNKE